MKKILLVSHQEPFLVRNQALLNRAGFVILTASSAEEAVQLHREQPVDLIISMLDMPEMAGDTLCSSIRTQLQGGNVPFILVCYDTDDALKRASRCGADSWIIKPVHPERLLESVGRFLRIPTRRDYRAMFTAKVRGMREAIAFSGMTHNISASGVLCETGTYLSRGDIITNMHLAIDAHDVVAEGIVARTEIRADGMFNYGVQFTNIAAESVERIERFIAAPALDYEQAPRMAVSAR